MIRAKFEDKYLNKGEIFLIEHKGVLKITANNVKFLEQDLGSSSTSNPWGRFDDST